MLVVLDDYELYDEGRPLPLHHHRRLISAIKEPLFRSCWENINTNKSGTAGGLDFGSFFSASAERLMRGLYIRNSRRALCQPNAWIVSQMSSQRALSEVKDQTPRARRLMRVMPYALSLTDRMRVFEHLVKVDKATYQPENTPGIPIRIRRPLTLATHAPVHRGHVLEDGRAALGPGGRAEGQMRRRLCVIFVGEAGHEESGIDMGGLFKDFWTDLSGMAFNINYGLFRITQEGLMYPSPSAQLVHGLEHLQLLEFVGRVLGKALYEGITVQPEFATFFLGFLRGDYNFLNLFHDLNGLDPELYRNLMFLKTYSGGDVEDLCLTFAITDEDFGANTEV
ncbi:unnamed protein product, partial [Discosporangium mesarthrocarpum]